MLLLRSHLKIPSSALLGVASAPATEEANVASPTAEELSGSQPIESEPANQASGESQDDQAASGVENMEQSDQDTGADSESAN